MVSLYVTILVFILAIFLFYFYIIRRKISYNSIQEGNVYLYRQEIAKLKKDRLLGYVNKKEFEIINNELSRRILNGESVKDSKNTSEDKKFFSIYIISLIFILLSTILIYRINGSPSMPDFSVFSRDGNTIPNLYWQLTLKDIDKKISKKPESIELFMTRANIFSTIGRVEESISDWEKVLVLQGVNMDISSLLSLGEAIVNKNISEKNEIVISDRAYDIFLKISSLTNIESLEGSLSRYYLSLAALEKGEIFKARMIWKEIQLKIPESVYWKKNILKNISELEDKYNLSRDENILEMVDRLERRLLEDESSNINDWKMLGKSSFVIQQYERAEKAYTKAYLLNTKDIEALSGLAESRLYQDKKDEYTMDLFKQVIEINENHVLALWVLAEYEISFENNSKAISILEKLLNILPSDVEEYSYILKKIVELRNKM